MHCEYKVTCYLNMPHRCLNSVDKFCYICGQITIKIRRRRMTAMIKKAYSLYFGCEIRDQDKAWAPHACCVRCGSYLRSWLKGKKDALGFATPMIWSEPSNHVNDCYFCMIPPIPNLNKRTRRLVIYPNVPSALRPVPHGIGLPIPIPPEMDTEIPEIESADEVEIKEEPFHAELASAELKLETEAHPLSHLHLNDEDPVSSMDESNEDLPQTETSRSDTNTEDKHGSDTSNFFQCATSANEGSFATRNGTASCERENALDAGVLRETELTTAAIAGLNNRHESSHENIRKRPDKCTSIPDFETEESRQLSTPDLQRLLLVEQLRLTRLQAAFYEKRMKTLPQ